MSFNIKELPETERPYEKLELYGEESLSNSELLAIILESGTKNETSIQLAYKVLSLSKESSDNELRFLQTVSVAELTKIKGIGRVKAIRIKAALEIAKRLSSPLKTEVILKSSKDVANLFMEELRYEKREIVKVVCLNNKNKILKIQNVSLGGGNYAVIEPKEILAEPVKIGATKVVLIHNHPSGNATPSQEDYEVSRRIGMCSKMFGIELVDHVVIGDGEYKSALI